MAIHYKDFKVIRTYDIKKSWDSDIGITVNSKPLHRGCFKIEFLQTEKTNDIINIEHFLVDNNIFLLFKLLSLENYQILFTFNGNIDYIKISTSCLYEVSRETGPACIYYTKIGNIYNVQYYIKDIYIGKTYTEYKQYIFKNKKKYSYLYQKILKKDALNIFD